MSSEINTQVGTQDSRFDLQSEVGKDQTGQREKKETPQEIAASGVFLNHLQAANKSFLNNDLIEELQVIASASSKPEGQNPATSKTPARDVTEVANKIATQVQNTEKTAAPLLGKATEIQVPIPANMLGISNARLVIVQGDLSVIVRLAAGGDAAIVSAAMQELAASLAQRFPNRAIRILKEGDDVQTDQTTQEFDPLNQPVRRRT